MKRGEGGAKKNTVWPPQTVRFKSSLADRYPFVRPTIWTPLAEVCVCVWRPTSARHADLRAHTHNKQNQNMSFTCRQNMRARKLIFAASFPARLKTCCQFRLGRKSLSPCFAVYFPKSYPGAFLRA